MITTLFLCVLLVYTAINPLLTFVYLVKRTSKEDLKDGLRSDPSIACVITAYKDWEIAVPLIKSVQSQSYHNFHIYLVADNCMDPVEIYDQKKLTIIEPKHPLNSKVKSIQAATAEFSSDHNAVLILDPDNLLQRECLAKLARAFQYGFDVVQGQRVAKNMDTKIAALDALGEIYYNFNQRLTPFIAGSSATIAGSGMMIELGLFMDYLNLFESENGVVLAEDKLLQMYVIARGKRIAYEEAALVFDEKSTTGAQVEKQRTRWLKSYFDHIGDAFSLSWKCFSQGNYQGAFFGLMISTPPFIFLVLLMLISSALSLLFNPLYLSFVGLGVLMFVSSWIFALLFSHAPKLIWKAIPWIPVFAFRQILSLMGFQKAKKDFLATEHTKYMDIEEVWEVRKEHFKHLNL